VATAPANVDLLPQASLSGSRGLLARIVLGREDDAAWVRPALLGLLICTAALYLWDLGASGWANGFYTAAVQAGTKSWKAFFFGSFDSSNFITVDKPPVSQWVMGLSGQIFGFSSASMLVPEALMAFTNALGVDSRSERARFYIGLAESQIGNLKQAVAIWRELEKTSPSDAPWLPMLREHIAVFSKQGGFDPASVPPSPPSARAMNVEITAMNASTLAKGLKRGERTNGDCMDGGQLAPKPKTVQFER